MEIRKYKKKDVIQARLEMYRDVSSVVCSVDDFPNISSSYIRKIAKKYGFYVSFRRDRILFY